MTATGNSWPDANCCVFDNTTTQKGTITFSATVNAWNGNAKGHIFNGNTWGVKAAKGDSKFVVTFTTTETATITIVQSLKDTGSNRGKVGIYLNKIIRSKSDQSTLVYQTFSEANASTGIVNATANNSTNSEVRIYKFYNMGAGDYTIKSGPDCQTSVAYVGVTYEETSPYTISTDITNGGSSTVSGEGNYYPNDSIKLAATPSAGKAFTKWSTDGGTNEVSTANPYYVLASANTTYTAVFADAATKTISTAVTPTGYGTAETTSLTVAAGGSTTLTATPASAAYAFVKWTKSSDGEWENTNASFSLDYDDIEDGETYTANFKQLYKITYSKGTYEAGSQQSYLYGDIVAYADVNDEITMPTNYGIVYSAEEAAKHTLTEWTDGESDYTVGTAYTLSGDLTLTPKFTTNIHELSHLNTEKTVTWEFGTDNGAPAGLKIEGKDGYYVVQTTIENETIDVPLYMDNTAGKFQVGATRAQVNSGSKFCVPAAKGMVVTYTADNGTPGVGDFAVDDDANTEKTVDGKVVTFTYNGENTSLTITDNNGSCWPVRLSVTYPAVKGPDAPEGDVVVTETWTKNSSGANVTVIAPDTYSPCITNELSNQNNSFGDYSKGWKIESTPTITVAVPANVTNSKITFYMDGSVTKFNINSEATETLTCTDWDAGSGATGKQVTLELTSAETTKNYVIGKNSGNPNIYKIIYTYTIEKDEVVLTTSDNMAGWRAFNPEGQGYTLDANTKAYVATSSDGSDVTLTSIGNEVPGNTPVILITSNTEDSYKMTLTKATVDDYAGAENLLKVAVGGENLDAYRLGFGGEGRGFYPYSTTSATAGVVYLDVTSSARMLSIVIDDETTGIKSVETATQNADGCYNLAGQRVAQPTKGLYIVNGKKVIIK